MLNPVTICTFIEISKKTQNENKIKDGKYIDKRRNGNGRS